MKPPSCPALKLSPSHYAGADIQQIIRKSLLLTFAFATFVVPPACRAQDQQAQQPTLDSVIAVARADMRADRATIITQAMDFSQKDAAAFWPIYRKYEYERALVDDRRVAVIKDYAEKFSSLSDADAKAMAERMFDCDSRLTELKKKYYKEFNKALPALTVTKFFQLEHRIDLVMDTRVEASLPPLFAPAVTSEDK